MTTLKSEEFSSRREEWEGWDLRVTTYRIGDRFFTKVDNLSPGAIIGRGEGKNAAESEREALDAAVSRLRLTRRVELTEKRLSQLNQDFEELRNQLETLKSR